MCVCGGGGMRAFACVLMCARACECVRVLYACECARAPVWVCVFVTVGEDKRFKKSI